VSTAFIAAFGVSVGLNVILIAFALWQHSIIVTCAEALELK
jgi:hypothetical protein